MRNGKKNRFATVLSHLRIDNSQTRDARKKDNPASAIYKILDLFMQNCGTVYSLGKTTCVDELLIAFRRCSKFKMYMPNKPAKYGLKLMYILMQEPAISTTRIYIPENISMASH